MAKVKIFLEDGETLQDAEDSLFKAMNLHNSGDIHSSHSFQDPAMAILAAEMESIHNKIYKEMLDEIFETLDKEYSSDGN